jgi:hypothetical protein
MSQWAKVVQGIPSKPESALPGAILLVQLTRHQTSIYVDVDLRAQAQEGFCSSIKRHDSIERYPS